MLELRDLVAARGDRPTGALARLIDYDRQPRQQPGRDPAGLARRLRRRRSRPPTSLFVHPNTFRYRLRRVAEVGEIDLADPDQRFVAMLQLRVLAPHA